MAWAGLRFADTQRTCPSSLLPDPHVPRRECWRTKVSRSGQAVSGRPPRWGWGHVYFNALCNWHSQMVDLGGQNLVIDYLVLRVVSHNTCPVAVANPMRFNDVSPASPLGTADAKRSSPALHAAQFFSHHAQHRKAGRCTRTPQG